MDCFNFNYKISSNKYKIKSKTLTVNHALILYQETN